MEKREIMTKKYFIKKLKLGRRGDEK